MRLLPVPVARWRPPFRVWWIPFCLSRLNVSSVARAAYLVQGYRRPTNFQPRHLPPLLSPPTVLPPPAPVMAPTARLATTKPGRVDEGDSPSPRPSKKRKATKEMSEAKREKSTKKASSTSTKKTSDSTTMNASPKAKKTPKHQVLTERDEIPKLWTPDKAKEKGSYTFKIASWNVSGLRALLRNHPNALSELVQSHNIDVLCLQETKLQESHLDDPKLKIQGHLLEEEGYDSYWSCATAKKGYAGTAVFVKRRPGVKSSGGKKKQTSVTSFFAAKAHDDGDDNDNDTKPSATAKGKTDESLPVDASRLVPENVSFEMGKAEHDAEGRLICLDFPQFTLCNVYVPNSGQKLERLDYRTKEWDKDLLEFVQQKQKDRGVPVLWLGDLNVAHTNLEVWNDGAKHLPKQAGVTPEERASFTEQLEAGFVDAFRHLHPTAAGHYSYWSQRAGNREPNKGLRLDYFVCDPALFDEGSCMIVRDSYMIPDQLGSDHCPVVLELEMVQN